MINLGNIVIEGFCSFLHTQKVNLDKKGLYLIKGENGNGKTTLFSALYWALYKENLKDVKDGMVATWPHLRTKEWRGTRVTIAFEITDTEHAGKYIVARHLAFTGTTGGVKGGNSLMIFKDGEIVPDHLHKGDIQGFINRILCMDSRVFINSILFGQRMTRLIQAPNDEKRKLLEELFELHFIEDAKKKGKDKIDAIAVDCTDIRLSMEKHNQQLINTEQLIEHKKGAKVQFDADKKVRIDALKGRKYQGEIVVSQLKDSIAAGEKLTASKVDPKKEGYEKDLPIRENDFKQAKIQLETAEDKINATSKELRQANAAMNKYVEELNCLAENCPYCQAPLDKENIAKVKKELASKIATEKKVVDNMELSLKKLNEEELPRATAYLNTKQSLLKEVKDKLQLILNAEGEFSSVRDKLLVDKSKLEQYMGQLLIIDGDIVLAEAQEYTETGESLELLTSKVAELKQKLQDLGVDLTAKSAVKVQYEWWVNKAFGASGLKSYVFNSMLEQMNILIQQYASRLGVRVKFGVDLTMASKPFTTEVYKGDHKVDYKELSGGQKQRIDICLAFTMFDLVSGVNPTNILILDEVLEGLDDAGCEEVFDLIRTKTGVDKTVYLITHNTNVDTHQARTLEVEFDGVSSFIRH